MGPKNWEILLVLGPSTVPRIFGNSEMGVSLIIAGPKMYTPTESTPNKGP